uniref:Gamma-glutamylcyclotransferase family protein n=1 Tax=Lygus hesperus TaxID=30085 RepID=A0A0A9VXG6_LYGHE
MIRVFVYGTLKKGEPNHYWLEDSEKGDHKYVGEGLTKSKYPLVVATRYNIPFLLDSPGKGHNIKGEIYEVDRKMLSNLDILEDHPNFYVRRLEEIEFNSTTHQCWTYFLPKFKPGLLEKKMLDCYFNDPNQPYLERYLRDPAFDFKTEIL